jgi:hypothetical protein
MLSPNPMEVAAMISIGNERHCWLVSRLQKGLTAIIALSDGSKDPAAKIRILFFNDENEVC